MELIGQYWWLLWLVGILVSAFVGGILVFDEEKGQALFPDCGPCERFVGSCCCLIVWVVLGVVVALFKYVYVLPESAFPVAVLAIVVGYAAFLWWVFGFSFHRAARGFYRRATAR